MSGRRPDLAAQLFHTYTARSRHDPSPPELAAMVKEGRLRLYPHPEAAISTDPSWTEDPLNDANWRFQYHSLVWLDRLREAAIEGDDAEAHGLYVRLLRSWLTANPVGAPAADYAWFDMAVGLRAVVLAFALDELGDEPWLLDAFTEHGRHLADPANYDARGNHGLHQDMGLLVAAQALGVREWRDLAVARIEEMFAAAVDDEGVCREGCIDYQYRNYRWYHEALTRMEAAGVPDREAFRDRLARMPEFLAHATSPSGDYALLGDTLLHSAPRIEGTAADWVRDRGMAPAETTRVFRSGYLFARRSWTTFREQMENAYLTQRFGPGRSTAVHGHEDAASITLDAFGESLVRDSGLYAYEAGDARLYVRGRTSHNVVDVPGRQYYPSAESELHVCVERDGAVLTTVLVKALQGTVWHRTTLWVPDAQLLVVDDRVRLHTPDTVHQLWHLPPDSVVEADFASGAVACTTTGGARLHILQAQPAPVSVLVGSRQPFAGWLSTEYRKLVPAPTLRFELDGSQVRFTTVLLYEGAANPAWEVTRLERRSKEALVGLTRDGRRLSIALTSEDFTVRSA